MLRISSLELVSTQSRTIRTLLRKNHFYCAALRWSSFWFSYVALLRAFTKISLRLAAACINHFNTFIFRIFAQKNGKIIPFFCAGFMYSK